MWSSSSSSSFSSSFDDNNDNDNSDGVLAAPAVVLSLSLHDDNSDGKSDELSRPLPLPGVTVPGASGGASTTATAATAATFSVKCSTTAKKKNRKVVENGSRVR